MINPLSNPAPVITNPLSSAPIQVAQQVAQQVGLPAVNQTLARLQDAAPATPLRSPASPPDPFSLTAQDFQTMGTTLQNAEPQVRKSWNEIAKLERDLNAAIKEENDPQANEILQSMTKVDVSMLMVMQYLRDQRMQELQRIMSKREEF
ncbi:MAG: hypothetical protein K2Q23_16335 [Bryobacteraceae bacterium]|nr:hypothetical protein [Bryobacteraceae bacterium]